MRFGELIQAAWVNLGDPLAETYRREALTLWLKAALREFPILRPMDETYTALAATHVFALPGDFRRVVSVEYPPGEVPRRFLRLHSCLDEAFWEREDWYDVSRGYAEGEGWRLITSAEVPAGGRVRVEYLATHAWDLGEDDALSVPDGCVNALLLYVQMTALRERLAYHIRQPTVHTSIIQQAALAARQAQKAYEEEVERLQGELAESRRVTMWRLDRFDRIY